jgi:hypothetical protein
VGAVYVVVGRVLGLRVHGRVWGGLELEVGLELGFVNQFYREGCGEC